MKITLTASVFILSAIQPGLYTMFMPFSLKDFLFVSRGDRQVFVLREPIE